MITPCINLCQLDATERYCIGCRRTVEELTNWQKLSEEQQQKILEELETRW